MTAGVRIRTTMCDSCIFHSGNRMQLRPGRLGDMLEQCSERDSFIPCHEFLRRRRGDCVAGQGARGAICRGFYDAAQRGGIPTPTLVQVAERLGHLGVRGAVVWIGKAGGS